MPSTTVCATMFARRSRRQARKLIANPMPRSPDKIVPPHPTVRPASAGRMLFVTLQRPVNQPRRISRRLPGLSILAMSPARERSERTTRRGRLEDPLVPRRRVHRRRHRRCTPSLPARPPAAGPLEDRSQRQVWRHAPRTKTRCTENVVPGNNATIRRRPLETHY